MTSRKKLTLASLILAGAAFVAAPSFITAQGYGNPAAAADEAKKEAKSYGEKKTEDAAKKAAYGEKKNLAETAVAAEQFTTLVAALQAAELVDTIANKGPFTVFAPTDDAFAKIPAETLNALIADKEALTKVLLHHVVDGTVPAAKVVGATEVETLNKTKLPVKVEGSTVTIGNARVIKTDVMASNGVIHVIDTVLLPEGLVIGQATAQAAPAAAGRAAY